MKKINVLLACLSLFFDLMFNSNKRKLFFGDDFNKKVMLKRYGIIPNHKVRKVAVMIKLGDQEKVHIIEERLK